MIVERAGKFKATDLFADALIAVTAVALIAAAFFLGWRVAELYLPGVF